MIFLLFVFTLILVYINNKIFEGNLFAPSYFLSICSFLSTWFAIINYSTWKLYLYSFKSFFLITIGLLSFTMCSLFITKTRISSEKAIDNFDKNSYNTNGYSIPSIIVYISIIICIYIDIKYYREVMQIATVGRAIYPIKDYPLLWYVSNVDTGMHISRATNNMTDISYVLSHLLMIYTLFNMINEKKIVKYLINLVPMILYSLVTLMFGGRNMILQSIISVLTAFFFIQKCVFKIPYKLVLKRNFKKIICIAIIVLFGFWALNGASGRVDTGQSVLNYLSMYLGAGIKNFDTFILRFDRNYNEYFGQETFAGIYSSLKGLFGTNYSSPTLEFAGAIDGFKMGNIYTAIRRYYHDFGISGVVLLSGLFGLITTLLYKYTKKVCDNFVSKKSIFFEPIILIYGNLLYGVAIFLIEDYLYISVLSLDTLLRFCELIIVNWLFIKLRIIKRITK